MMQKCIALTLVAGSILISGCQTNHGLYHWGEYESGLYQYYKDPAELNTLSEKIRRAIDEAHGRVAPGLYAEYGTLMLHQGNTDQAITYYTKERELWPESQPLMNAIINNLKRKQKADS